MAIVLVGIFSYGVSLYVVHVVDSWKFLTQRYKLEQDGKLAIDFLVRDLREIDIDSFGRPRISSASSSSISFTDADNEVITYSFSSDTVYKNNHPLLRNVSDFKIKYYNQDNNEISPPTGGSLSPGQIRWIWYLYIRFVIIEAGESAVYSSYIFPRNFLAR